jgi:hypothetical protein
LGTRKTQGSEVGEVRGWGDEERGWGQERRIASHASAKSHVGSAPKALRDFLVFASLLVAVDTFFVAVRSAVRASSFLGVEPEEEEAYCDSLSCNDSRVCEDSMYITHPR